MDVEEPKDEDYLNVATMLEDEMSKTSFLNAMGFLDYEEVNNFEGLADEEFQDFIMHYGEDDNKKALLFVWAMKNETLKRMEKDVVSEEQGEEEWKDGREEGGSSESDDGCAVKAKNTNSDTDKTQHKDLSANAKNAGEVTEGSPGRVTP